MENLTNISNSVNSNISTLDKLNEKHNELDLKLQALTNNETEGDSRTVQVKNSI